MTKPLDLSRPVRTRDGRAVRILCTDRRQDGGLKPVVGLISTRCGEERICSWSSSGRCGSGSLTDLINVPVKREGWVNVYAGVVNSKRRTLRLYDTRDEAESYADQDDYLTTVHIEWDE